MIGYTSDKFSGGSGKTAYWFQRRRRAQRNRFNEVEGGSLFGQMISRDSLYRAYEDASQYGGQAAGIDGIRYTDLSRNEVGEIMDWLSQRLQNETYRPQPTRPEAIPKPGSEELRILQIGTICDRAVAKSLNDKLVPLFESIYLDGSWGFRRGRSPLQMLAHLAVRMKKQNHWTLAIADIRKAFDSVLISDVLLAHKKLFEGQLADKIPRADRHKIWRLIRTVLQGADSQRQVGIDQGCPYSPTALNVLLHLIHDAPLQTEASCPSCYRYADNLTYLCRDVPDGRQVLYRVQRLLQSKSLELKEDADVHDLAAGEEATLMGFILRRNRGRLLLTIGDSAWDTLREHLRNAHSASNPTLAAKRSIRGWIANWGLAIETVESATERMLHISAEYGFRETISPTEFSQLVDKARLRWRRLLLGAAR